MNTSQTLSSRASAAHTTLKPMPWFARLIHSGTVGLLLGAGLLGAGQLRGAPSDKPLLTPLPQSLTWTSGSFELKASGAVLAAGGEEQQVARVLVSELSRLHGMDLRISGKGDPGGNITLALTSSSLGKKLLSRCANRAQWPPARNAAEGYLLEASPQQVVVLAETPRGLLYGCQTLLQLVRPAGRGSSKQVPGASILDYPQLGFRSVHICIFPNTELAAVRQAILLAARYKYNAIVLEPWASLKSKSHPETAYEHAYSPEQLKPLIDLGRALHMEMIPMLNSWGHASGMRSRSGEHVVLDRFPQFKALYEPDGWSFCLSNPAVYDHLFDRYDELLKLFGPVKYFHAGMDEAWGHLGLKEARECRGDDPRQLIVRHLLKIHDYFAQRKIQVFMWHDMFIQRDHPQLGRLSPANSVPPINTHLALPDLPKDVIIAAWNYDNTAAWPVPKYFHEQGYPVVVSPWKSRPNTIMLLNIAKQLDLLGVMATTWDSLDVSLPSVAHAGVLAWTAPGFDLKTIPFDHWVSEIQQLPIEKLPRLESTLAPVKSPSRK